jgi:hypothetical protein
MKASIKSSFTLIRQDDISSIETTITMIPGMPSMLHICQKSNGGASSKISITLTEAEALRYALGEFGAFNNLAKNMSKNEERECEGDDGRYHYHGAGVSLLDAARK